MGGHYNKAKTVSENLRLSGPLLSRFDLVFILLDKPDEEMDALLSEHVMAMHTGKSHGGMEDSRPDNSTVKGFYPTALKGCRGIVFTHGVRMGGRAAGNSLPGLYLRNRKV